VSIAVILVVAITVRLVPILQRWISAHDKNPGSGQFLLPPPGAAGMKQVLYVVAYAESLTLPLALAAVVGIYLLWRERDRSLALLLTCLALFPVIFLTLISIRTPVSTYYLLAAVPAVFMGAGIFLDRLAGLDWKPGPRWLLPGTVALMMISAGVPTLLSDYRDGRRYDFRRAAEWLKPRLAPGDVVYSDQPMVLAHYLPVTPVQRLRYDPAPLQDSVRTLNAGEREGTLWIVAPAPSHALRTNLKRGGMIDWIFDSCQLRYTRGVGRVDFRQQYLQIYRCPPAKGAGVSSE
jgi:hypothetical protein